MDQRRRILAAQGRLGMMADWIIIAVGFISAFISSSVGFGGAMVMAPLLFFVLPPPQAVLTTALLASTTNFLIVTEKREKHFVSAELGRLALGTLPGMIVGIFLLEHISTAVALVVTGLAILFGVGLRVFASDRASRLPNSTGYGVGLGSGVLATTTGLAALAPAWFIIRNIQPAAVRDSLNLYYLGTGLGTFLLGIFVIGAQTSLPPLWALLAGVGAVIGGHRLGRIVFLRLAAKHERYTKISLVLLVLISAVAIARGLLDLI